MGKDSFFTREGRAKKFYPVIHVRDMDQASHGVATAFLNGADGVFLINHDVSTQTLFVIAALLRASWPQHFIGLNVLDTTAENAWTLVTAAGRDLNALWVDDAGIDDVVFEAAERLHATWRASTWPGYYFASVAFKGWAPVTNVATTAALARDRSDVVVTSGPQTGSPPSVEKIRNMKAVLPDHPLAIASGMTCQNIHQFLPYADIFMVATGISDKDDRLDPRLVDRMATIVRNYNATGGRL
jgi:predicted TIM-barrel enzyme